MSNTYYLDLLNGDDTQSGLSFASRVKSFTRIATLLNPGDTVLVMESPVPQVASVNATWLSKSCAVTTSGPTNASIDYGNDGWMSASPWCVVVKNIARFKLSQQGIVPGSVQFTIAATWTTGVAAYKNLPAAINLAAYQQVSFWVYVTQPIPSGLIQIRLCSGLNGTLPLYTVNCPAVTGVNQWMPVTINTGSRMVGSIASIAVTVNAASAAYPNTFYIDNIVACQAPGAGCVTHQTLIGKPNSTGAGGTDAETWYAVGGIDAMHSKLNIDRAPNSLPNSAGYYGVSETVPLWTREPILTVPVTAPAVPAISINNNGTISSLITWSFGMASSGMAVQTGQTWLSGQNGLGSGIYIGADFNAISAVAAVRYFYGIYLDQSHGGKHNIAAAAHCTAGNVYLDGPSTANEIAVGFLHNSAGSGYEDDPDGGRNDISIGHAFSNYTYGAIIAANDLLHDGLVQFNGNGGILTSGATRIYRIQTDDNGQNLAHGSTGDGLSATYFNGDNFTGVTFARIDSQINFHWPNTPPLPGFAVAPWTARWTGFVTPLFSEYYTFYVEVDDGARVWLNGTLIIDNWVSSVEHEVSTPTPMSLVANQAYTLIVEYQNTLPTEASIYLKWSSPSQAKQIIPPDRFSQNMPSGSSIVVLAETSVGYEINCHDCLFNETNKFGGFERLYDTRVRSHNHMKVKGNHLMVTDGGQVVNETGADRHTLSGFAWKIQPNAGRSSLYPLDYKLASIAVVPNKPVTVSAFFKRSDANVTGQLLVPGGQLDGIPADVITTLTTIAAYQQLSVTFTPNEIGVIDIYARAFGGTTSSVWVDDMAVSQ